MEKKNRWMTSFLPCFPCSCCRELFPSPQKMGSSSGLALYTSPVKVPCGWRADLRHQLLRLHWSKKGHFIFPSESLCPTEVTAWPSMLSLYSNCPPELGQLQPQPCLMFQRGLLSSCVAGGAQAGHTGPQQEVQQSGASHAVPSTFV